MKDRRVWIILLVALGLRMVLLHCAFTDCRGALPPASSKYDSLAFFMGDPRWSYEDSVARSPDSHVKIVPEIQVPPGYPALCFAANWVAEQIPEADDSAYADDHNRASRSQQIVISFQVLVDLHLVLLTFLLGRALAGHTAGLVAELFQALSPLAAAASVRLLPDGILAFLLTASVILMIRHFRTGGWVSLLTAGLLVSGASYFQPVGLVLAGVMIAVLLFRVKRFRRTAAFAGVVAVCIGPWVMRNVTQAGYWGFSSFLTDDLYRFSAAEIEARRQGEPVWRIRKHRFEQEGWLEWGNSKPKYPDAPCYLSPGGLAGYRWRKTREIIAEHPGDFVDLHMRGNLAFWLPGATDVLEVAGLTYGGRATLDILHRYGLVEATTHYFSDNTGDLVSPWAAPLAGVMVAVLLIRYLGVLLCGLWRLRPRMTVAGWLCVLLVLAAFLLPGPANHPRFRVPVEPILSAAAAIGYVGLIERRRRRCDERRTATVA